MDELTALLRHWRARQGMLDDAVLASVVHVRGSAYRRPGARMLIGADGTRIGTVSGGCLETEVVRKAWWWTDGGPTVRVFDNGDEDAARDFGLGCNGQITVLLERAGDAPAQALLALLDAARAAREAVVVATTVRATARSDAKLGDRLLFDARGPVGWSGEACTNEAVASAVAASFTTRQSRLLHLDDREVFVEWVGPPQRVFLFGAGHDAAPLAAAAALVGWQVTVADSRASCLDANRFPAARSLFLLPPSNDISALGIGSDDAVVLMTHHYPQDAELLPQLLEAGPRYLGMLGPRRRAERLFGEIGAECPSFVHAPVGLDIGGDHPETIALAIVAELQALLSGRDGRSLRDKAGSIHEAALEWHAASPGASEDWQPAAPEPVACGIAAHG